MNSGMYAALSGNISAMKRLDIISNNLANAGTPGFKRDRLAFESLLQQAGNGTAPASAGVDASPVFTGERYYTDFTPGPLQQTGNTFDLALAGDGFFAVNTPQGTAYTRQGNFRMDVSGKVVTSDGYTLSPEISIPNGATQITFGSDGTVSAYLPGESAPVTIGTLQIVDFPKPYALQKIGSALFMPTDTQASPETAQNTTITQGAIEGANMSTISEMVQMIENSRYFEACSKVVKSFDDMAAKAANDLGKV